MQSAKVQLAVFVDPMCWDEPSAVPFRPAYQRRVVGDNLRHAIASACKQAGGASAGAETNWVGFRRPIPATEKPNVCNSAVGRRGKKWEDGGNVDCPTWGEDVARLCGAIRTVGDGGFPEWFRKMVAGGGKVRHVRGHSRTWEARAPMFNAWTALRRISYAPHRLLRAIDKLRRQIWVRWAIDCPTKIACEALTHGKRQRIASALRGMIESKGNTVRWDCPLPICIRLARLSGKDADDEVRRLWAREHGMSSGGTVADKWSWEMQYAVRCGYRIT